MVAARNVIFFMSCILLLFICCGKKDKGINSAYKFDTVQLPASVTAAGTFSEGLAYITIDSGCGYIDKSGQIVIKPQYDECGRFEEGFADVKIGDSYGFINKTGQLVIPAQYDHVAPFSDGFAKVDSNGKCGYINYQGKMIVDTQYSICLSFTEGLASVQDESRRCGYINTEGTVALPLQYDSLSCDPFRQGLAKARIGGKAGLINKQGEFVLKPEYDALNSPSEDMILFGFDAQSETRIIHFGSAKGIKRNIEPGSYGYMKLSGEIVIFPELQKATDFHQGMAMVTDVRGRNFVIRAIGGLIGTYVSGFCGYMDKTGKYVIPPVYEVCDEYFSEKYARVAVGDNLGVINRKGDMVLEAEYDRYFSDGYDKPLRVYDAETPTPC
jgi:hypothetical protein